MSNLFYLFFIIFFFYFINKILIKKKLLLSYTGESHQNFVVNEKVPLSGGIIIFLSFYFFFLKQFPIFSFFLLGLFIIGIMSDLKNNFSPKKRLIFQIIVVMFCIYFIDIRIQNTRIYFLDQLLDYYLINYLFVLFCFLILINGSNFIDGLNTLLIGYYLIISILLLKTSFLIDLNIDLYLWLFWISVLIIIFLFNFFKKIFLGDNGAYILGFIYGFLLIKYYSLNNESVSPFFIICLLWYPCFEMLFSIIRKTKNNYSAMTADVFHLHQIIFYYFRNFKFKNSLSAILINLYNLFIFNLSFLKVESSIFQISLILTNIFIYIVIYFILLKLIKKYK